MKPLINPQLVQRLFLFLAFAGPLVGLIMGAIFGAHERHAARRIAAGVLLGGFLTLTYGMWRLYGAITDSIGLDSVANFGLQLLMFAALGAVLGAVVVKVSLFLKRLGREVSNL